MSPQDYSPMIAQLQIAIDHLEAKEVAPGRYALYDDKEKHRWYITSADGVLDIFEPTGGNYRELQPPTEMPSWWTPEMPVKYVRDFDGDVRFDFISDVEAEYQGYRKITVDLETGEEVPA